MSLPTPSPAATAALAPTGVLRAAINLSNFLLVSRTDDDGTPHGVSPGIAAALATQLGVDLEMITFANPGDVADAVVEGGWDIGNIGADPKRAEHIDFTAAYAEIESTYLVRGDSPIQTFADADQPGVRISVKARAAYALWLERNLAHATLVNTESLETSFETFVADRLDALAGLRPRLEADAERIAGARVLPGKFSAVQQAIGTPKGRDDAGITYLHDFVEAAKATGLVARLIEEHDAAGLSVAPVAG